MSGEGKRGRWRFDPVYTRELLIARQSSERSQVPDPPATAGKRGPRILAKSVERANENLAKQKRVPLPEGLTPHKLRHTFASILYALGVDPGVVIDEMGHTDPALALRLYRHSMRRGDDERARLRALVSSGSERHSRYHAVRRLRTNTSRKPRDLQPV